MSVAFEEILHECIRAVENGEHIEQIVTCYPAHAEELQQALRTVEMVMHFPTEPTHHTRENALNSFLNEAEQLHHTVVSPSNNGHQDVADNVPVRLTRRLEHTSTTSQGGLHKRLLSVTSAAAILIGTASMYVFLKASYSLPGDSFYALKLQIEDVQRASISDQNRLNAFDERLEERRVNEVKQLLGGIQTDELLVFEGTVEVVYAASLTVAGVDVQINESTVTEGLLTAGSQAEVTGTINNRAQFVASSIVVGEPEEDSIRGEVTETPINEDNLDEEVTPVATAVPMPTNDPFYPDIQTLEPVEVD